MFKSQAQARLFFAAKDKKDGLDGLKQSTASKFIADTDHQKIGSLPEHVKSASQEPKKPRFPKIKKSFGVKS